MTAELTQGLVQSRHYCTDRLIEVKEEVARLQTEGDVLKTKLETAADEIEAGQIRRRRRFLARRLDELKAERASLTTELQTATARLSNATVKASNEWHATPLESIESGTGPSEQEKRPAPATHDRASR